MKSDNLESLKKILSKQRIARKRDYYLQNGSEYHKNNVNDVCDSMINFIIETKIKINKFIVDNKHLEIQVDEVKITGGCVCFRYTAFEDDESYEKRLLMIDRHLCDMEPLKINELNKLELPSVFINKSKRGYY